MSFAFNEPTSTHPTPSENTNVTPDDPTTADVVTNPADVVPPVGTNTVPSNTGAETVEVPTGGEGDDKPDDQPKPDDTTATPETVEYYFGEDAVTIDIPQDVTDALAEHGLDAVAIANELYSKGGEFTLSAETKEKLDKIYGKFAVDSYLAGLKAQNEGFLHQQQRDAEATEKANTERFDVVAKEAGGAKGWANLERFALETLPDDELAAFNAVMESGNQYLQMYAVRELEARRKAAQGDDKVNLVDATSTAGADNDNAPMSGQDYVRAIAMLGKTYGNDRVARAAAEKALDARRTAGMELGL